MTANVVEIIPAVARRHPDKTALRVGDLSLTYRELDDRIARFAAALRALGVVPQDRVTLYVPNGWQWVVAYHGALRLGAVINPVNILLTADEIDFIVGDCGATVLIAAADRCAALDGAAVREKLRHAIAVGDGAADGWLGFEALLDGSRKGVEPVVIEVEALSTIAYTSGTTGRPKGAMQSHRSIHFNAVMTAVMHARDSHDVVATALPCPHVYGNVVMNSTFLVGGTLVLHARFDAGEMLRSMERERATLFEGVPTMYFFMLAHPDLDRCDLGSLKRCTVGGQTMPTAKMLEVEARFGCPLVELWGMTELAGLGSTHAFHAGRVPGSIGFALPQTELRIVRTTDPAIEMPIGEVGELMARGPHVMSGYFGNEQATRDTVEADGWLHSGDIAYMDADRNVFIVDRKKDMILTAGYNVYPAEIERVLAAHPAVAMVAVGSIPDETKGELAKAYVVLKAGADAAENEMIEFCRPHLAAYKLPRAVQFVVDLPRTSTGKILRRELRNHFH